MAKYFPIFLLGLMIGLCPFPLVLELFEGKISTNEGHAKPPAVCCNP